MSSQVENRSVRFKTLDRKGNKVLSGYTSHTGEKIVFKQLPLCDEKGNVITYEDDDGRQRKKRYGRDIEFVNHTLVLDKYTDAKVIDALRNFSGTKSRMQNDYIKNLHKSKTKIIEEVNMKWIEQDEKALADLQGMAMEMVMSCQASELKLRLLYLSIFNAKYPDVKGQIITALMRKTLDAPKEIIALFKKVAKNWVLEDAVYARIKGIALHEDILSVRGGIFYFGKVKLGHTIADEYLPEIRNAVEKKLGA